MKEGISISSHESSGRKLTPLIKAAALSAALAVVPLTAKSECTADDPSTAIVDHLFAETYSLTAGFIGNSINGDNFRYRNMPDNTIFEPDALNTAIDKIRSYFPGNEKLGYQISASVSLKIEKKGDKESICNGVYVGNGIIWTDAHCIPDYLTLKYITVTDSRRKKHKVKYYTKDEKTDSAVILLSDENLPGKANVGSPADLKIGSEILVFSLNEESSPVPIKSNLGIFNGSEMPKEKLRASHGLDSSFEFTTDKDSIVRGDSGSGIYDRTTGILVGILTTVCLKKGDFTETQKNSAARAEVFISLTKSLLESAGSNFNQVKKR